MTSTQAAAMDDAELLERLEGLAHREPLVRALLDRFVSMPDIEAMEDELAEVRTALAEAREQLAELEAKADV